MEHLFTNLTGKIISPRFSSFWDVLEDRRGNLWFASTRFGCLIITMVNPFNILQPRKDFPVISVGFIHEDKAGTIWFSTGGGLSRYDGKSFRNFTTKDGLSNNDPTTIMEDKTGKLWFGTRGEPCFYDGKTFTVFKNEDGKAFNNVWSIIEDKKGNIWFGDVDGVWRYDGRTFTKVSQRGAYAILEDRKGNIWTTSQITTSQINPNGPVWALFRYDQKSLYNKNPTVTEISVRRTS